MLLDFASRSLPKDFASEFDRVMTTPYVDDGKGVYDLTELRELHERMNALVNGTHNSPPAVCTRPCCSSAKQRSSKEDQPGRARRRTTDPGRLEYADCDLLAEHARRQ